MRQLLHLHTILSRWPRASAALGFLVVAVALGSVNWAWADRFPPDPVEALRQALRQDKDGGKTKAGEDFRKENLDKQIAALRSPGDMSQALLLSEWQDTSLDPTVGRVDQRARELLANRFKDEIRRLLTKGDAPARLAAAGLVGDTAALARAHSVQAAALEAALSDLGMDLVKLTKDPNVRVREQAVRSLGKIQADPTKVVPALENLLTDQPLTIRRAVAEALSNLVRILQQAAKRPPSLGPIGSGIQPEERIRLSRAVVPGAGRGLADRDPEVRRLCADTLWQAALVLSDLIADPGYREAPPEGRVLTEEEKKNIDSYRDLVVSERQRLMPLSAALGDQASALANAASDPEVAVRVLALHALEEIGNARLRLLRRAASVPVYKPLKEGENKNEENKKEDVEGAGLNPNEKIRYALAQDVDNLPPFRLPEGQDPLLSGLRKTLRAQAKALADPKPQVRLAAVDALEMLGDEAVTVAPHLAWALTDPDRFVRWSAARTLGRMTPSRVKDDTVVPNLTRMLADPDLDLRLIAAESLEHYGPAAKAAVPELSRATVTGDAEIRRAAIRALVGIGTDAESAVPNIGAALQHPDVRVRRTAAEALSRFGPLAKSAEESLQKALGDPDAEVRRLAEDALLKIQ
jgi:HEAT repeat protein